MVDGDKVTFLEISPRNGGNGIPEIIEQFYGVDLIEASTRLCLGETFNFKLNNNFSPVGSYVFSNDQVMRLLDNKCHQKLESKIKGFTSVVLSVKEKSDSDTGANPSGYCYFFCDGSSYHEIVRDIELTLT